jgi:hypothetical protein
VLKKRADFRVLVPPILPQVDKHLAIRLQLKPLRPSIYGVLDSITTDHHFQGQSIKAMIIPQCSPSTNSATFVSKNNASRPLAFLHDERGIDIALDPAWWWTPPLWQHPQLLSVFN